MNTPDLGARAEGHEVWFPRNTSNARFNLGSDVTDLTEERNAILSWGKDHGVEFMCLDMALDGNLCRMWKTIVRTSEEAVLIRMRWS